MIPYASLNLTLEMEIPSPPATTMLSLLLVTNHHGFAWEITTDKSLNVNEEEVQFASNITLFIICSMLVSLD